MKKSISGILLSLIIILVFSCNNSKHEDAKTIYAEIDQKAAANALTVKESDKGWVLLFDGVSSDGWHGYNIDGFSDSWAIEEGTLTMNSESRGEEQDIITNKTYKSFALSLEYKMAEMANSGIIYQVKEDTAYKYPYETGPEFQIIDHQNWTNPLEDWQINGANYAMYPPRIREYKEVGEWNHLLLIVQGNKVTQMLNGNILVEYEKYSDEWMKLKGSGKWLGFPDWGKFDEGNISLQNHGTRVWFRSIKLKEL